MLILYKFFQKTEVEGHVITRDIGPAWPPCQSQAETWQKQNEGYLPIS